MNLGAEMERAPSRGFDLTPMIDVVLQLIIFFMFTSQLGELVRTEVRLPDRPGQQDRARPGVLRVDVSAEGLYFVDQRPIDLDRLVVIAQAAGAGLSTDQEPIVRVRADQACAAVHLDRLINALGDAGVTRWSLGMSGEGPPE